MDFSDQIHNIAAKIHRQRDSIETEGATKNAFVLPFISALGYDIFDPTEVLPEFTADVGIKKGEKVDYAIFKDGKPILLFECKPCHTDLNHVHASQLYRYFSVTETRIAVLTNGVLYRFYTDLEKPNQMDAKPFLEFDFLDIHEPLVNELKKLSKLSFNIDEMLTAASELKYTREIRLIMAEQLRNPSEEFVRFFTSQVYQGRIIQSVREQFVDITKRALNQFINEQINKRLQSALGGESALTSEVRAPLEGELEEEGPSERDNRIVTTEEEIEGYHIVKAILREAIDPKRVTHRDTRSYYGILLDDNNRKPICRLHFNRGQKYLGLFDQEKKEQRVPIDDLNDIYQYADQLKATIGYYAEIKTGELSRATDAQESCS